MDLNKKGNYGKEGTKTHSYILRAHIKDHATWRLMHTGRDLLGIPKVLENTKNIVDWEIIQMDGLTGEFTSIQKSK